jgi:Transposase DDE domain group 1
MRVIVRKERPHPGAQLRFTDIDGHRFTAFAASAKSGQLADLELRHRRARCEDRIRCAKDTGLRNLPLHGYEQNPDLVRDRRPGVRVACLDADARPDRHCPPVGTQAPAAAAVLGGREDRPQADGDCGYGSPPDGLGPTTSLSPSGTLKTRTTRRLKPPTQDHETSRLGRGVGRLAKARTYKTRHRPLA